MGLISTLRNFTLRMGTADRETIWKAFGSFNANKFATSGSALIENSYEKNIDVYAVIKKIVDVTKSIPWIVEERKADGTFETLTDTTIHELMYSPNVGKGYTWNDIEEQLLVYLLTSGNSYLYGQTGLSSLIVELDILPSTMVCIKSNNSFFIPNVKYNFTINSGQYTFDKDQVAHFKLFNPAYSTIDESLYGLSPIQVAAMVVQSGNDRWEADAALLQNRGAIGMITDKSNRPMLPDEAARVQADFDRQTAGTHNFGKIKVTNKDLAYIQMAMSSADLQLIEKGVVNLRAICNVFGLDSSLFNDPENKTYNNRKEAEKSMYTNAIMPLSDRLGETFTRFLCKNHFPDKTVRMRQDFSGIEVLQENFKEKAEVYSMLKRDGIISANTAAEALKLPISTDEHADDLLVSNNLITLSSLTEPKTNEKDI